MSGEYFAEYFGTYRLIRSIGRGSMGEVYLAIDDRSQREVAIKQMLPHLAQDYEYCERFERECQIVSNMKSEYVVPVHAFGQIGSTLFIVMEYVDGRDLGSLIAEVGEVPPPRTIPIIAKIARCLEEARRRDVVHRDVKPSNILLANETDHPYLLDFGLAKAVGVHKTVLSSIGHAIGTIAYMAPESLAGQADHRSDIYSLTCVFYECITGRKPYAGVSLVDMARSHAYDDIPKPSDHKRELEPFDNVVLQGLAKGADNRFQTSLEFSGALISAMQQYAKNQRINFDIGPLKALQDKASMPRKRRTFLREAIVAVPLVAGGLAAWATYRRDPTTRSNPSPAPHLAHSIVTEQSMPDQRYITSMKTVDSNLYISAVKPGVNGFLTGDGILAVLDIRSGFLRTITTYPGNAANMYASNVANIAVRAGGKAVYIAGVPANTVRSVDRMDGSLLASAIVPEPGAICISADGTQVFVSGHSSVAPPTVYALNVPKLDIAMIINTPGNALLDLVASPNLGTLYAVTNQQGNANIWVIELGRKAVVNGISLNENYPLGVGISPEGSRLYVASDNNSLLIIDTAEKTVLRKFRSNINLSAGIAVAWNRNTAFVAGEKVVGINLDNGKVEELVVPAPTKNGYTAIALTPDESKLILSSGNRLCIVRL